ncbi:hypothetical protein CerSpe_228750 [Prunus speciosa]
MKEYGVAESWAKLFTICPQEIAARLPPGFRVIRVNPLGFRKGGEVVLKWISDDYKIYPHHVYRLVDPDTKECNDFRMDGYCSSDYHFMDYFVESLVLLDHPDVISY